LLRFIAGAPFAARSVRNAACRGAPAKVTAKFHADRVFDAAPHPSARR
jgi:hypothetical protein